jgi:hypothetical protein
MLWLMQARLLWHLTQATLTRLLMPVLARRPGTFLPLFLRIPILSNTQEECQSADRDVTPSRFV